MHGETILEYLHKHGQQIDADVAKALRLPLHEVKITLEKLAMKGALARSYVTRFVDGERFDGILYRPLGYVLKTPHGRNPGPP